MICKNLLFTLLLQIDSQYMRHSMNEIIINSMRFSKHLFLTFVVALVSFGAWAQPIEPVAWKTSVTELSDGEYRIDFKASVDNGWHMYDLGPYEGGPMATTFTFEPSADYELVGGVTADKDSHEEMNEHFGMEIGSYEGSVTF